MLDMKQHNVLENIFDTTFGRGSLKEGHALKHKLGTDVDGTLILELRYESACNFNPAAGLASQKKELDKDSFKRVHDMFYNNENFPWFPTPVLDYKEHKQFVHFFYYDHKPNSIYNEILKPIYTLLGVKALIKVMY